MSERRFPSPFDIPVPDGAEGWTDLYSYSSVFSEDRREQEDQAFWFQDGVHWPMAMTPWDATFYEYAIASLSQYNTRHYIIPPAMGIDYRILYGYAYLSPVGVADPAEIGSRVPEFMERAGHYFANWNDLYANWLEKIRALIHDMELVQVEPLPDREPLEVVTEGRGTGSGLALMESYHRILDLGLKLWQYHFEFLNLGYAAYLDFFGFCKQAWPNIPDLAIAKMVAGVDVDLFRPDDELKKLARLAVGLGLDQHFTSAGRPDVVDEALQGSDEGRQWLAAWAESAEPWFNFSSGSGFYHSDHIWIEHREIPYGFIGNYTQMLREGTDLARPLDEIRAERDRIVLEYAELLPSDDDRSTFEQKLGLARTVFPYVENHNFYVEHWSHSVLWRKMRALGGVLVKEGFLAEEDDIFFLKRNEVPDALWDMYSSWAVGAPSRGPAYWPPEIERRKQIVSALEKWSPPPALGAPPEVVTEPFTIMLWGITSESVAGWLGGADDESGDLKGMAASPGVVEGLARVIFSPAEIGEVQDGEILVAPLTAPSWAPIFRKIRATVTDVGGMMSHAAIVCREYGLPAVTGTAFGTKRIKTGQRLRVDGSNGTVTVLDD
ncbi:MAG: pyruvate, water dikinase [Actinomycetota bacterium]|jgi:pyruvate,water dikinase|nr:pyruvate, water dikinase [Actinomycetota bacterium]